jgi:hypothetical protein
MSADIAYLRSKGLDEALDLRLWISYLASAATRKVE